MTRKDCLLEKSLFLVLDEDCLEGGHEDYGLKRHDLQKAGFFRFVPLLFESPFFVSFEHSWIAFDSSFLFSVESLESSS